MNGTAEMQWRSPFYRGFGRTQSPQNFPEGRLLGMANVIHAMAFC